jgi:hypothetical protein
VSNAPTGSAPLGPRPTAAHSPETFHLFLVSSSKLSLQNISGTSVSPRTAVAQWLRCCAPYRKVAGSIPTGVSGFFVDIKFFPSHYGPEVDSASNINDYQEYFLG